MEAHADDFVTGGKAVSPGFFFADGFFWFAGVESPTASRVSNAFAKAGIELGENGNIIPRGTGCWRSRIINVQNF